MDQGNVFLVYVKSGHTEALFDVPCFVPSTCSLSELKSLVSHHLGGRPSPEDMVLARANEGTLVELDEPLVRSVQVLFVYTATGWQAKKAGKECQEAVAETFLLETTTKHVDTSQFIRAKGEMAVRIRDYPWSETQLGAMSMWSETLLSSVNSLLSSKFPMALMLGADYIMIYNDGYTPMLGAKHPLYLGKPLSTAWSEVWKDIEPMLRSDAYGGAHLVQGPAFGDESQ